MFRIAVFGDGHEIARHLDNPKFWSFIERWELYREKRYADGVRQHDTPAGPKGSTIWSIGFGHAEDGDVEPKVITADMRVSLAEARHILKLDVARKAHWVNVRIKPEIALTPFMFQALTSMTFQFGQGRLDRLKTEHPDKADPIALLNTKDYIDAAVAMSQLNFNRDGTFNKGLHIRRACEVEHYMTRVDKNPLQ